MLLDQSSQEMWDGGTCSMHKLSKKYITKFSPESWKEQGTWQT